MTSARDLESLIRHAEAYPYERPAGSFLYDEGAVRSLGRLRLADRVPAVAAGSNAAPARLAAKFKGRPATTIPITRARLRDHAVVYAAHSALYGALPATLHRVAGAESEVLLTWLTPAQLACMHACLHACMRARASGRATTTSNSTGWRARSTASARSTRRAPTSAATARWSTAQGRCAWPRCRRRAAHCGIDAIPHAARSQRPAGANLARRFMGRILRSLRYRTQASTTLARSAIPWTTADTL